MDHLYDTFQQPKGHQHYRKSSSVADVSFAVNLEERGNSVLMNGSRTMKNRYFITASHWLLSGWRQIVPCSCSWLWNQCIDWTQLVKLGPRVVAWVCLKWLKLYRAGMKNTWGSTIDWLVVVYASRINNNWLPSFCLFFLWCSLKKKGHCSEPRSSYQRQLQCYTLIWTLFIANRRLTHSLIHIF